MKLSRIFTGDAGKSEPRSRSRLLAEPAPGKGRDFEAFWETSLHDGLMAGTAFPAISASGASGFRADRRLPRLRRERDWKLYSAPILRLATANTRTTAGCRKRPKPVTRLTWDNAAMISPATAQQMGLTTGDYVTLQLERPRSEGRSVDRSGPRG